MHKGVQAFACQQCGFCCHGETTVSLDQEDQNRMIAALGLRKQEVSDRYWRITDSTVQMKTVDGHCIFYNDGCTVYSGRPKRCAQWPLVPAICLDESNFLTISNSCCGINKSMSYREFCKVLVRKRQHLKKNDD